MPKAPVVSKVSRTPGELWRTMREFRRAAGVDQASQRVTLWFVLPLWMGAGVADWWLHRRGDIEHTSGTHESLTHSAMMLEGAVPTTLALFFEVNAGLLATVYGAVAAHEATAIWDVHYANDLREVSDVEQHVHAALEMTPVMAAGMMTAMHWDQARSLFGKGGEKPRFRLTPKRYPLPLKIRAGVIAASTLFVAAPYAEELFRCWRVDRTAAPHEAEDRDAIIARGELDSSPKPEVGAARN